MIMYDQDPDVLLWGLNLLCGDPFTNSEYCATISNYYDLEEDNQGADCTLENDELLAHALLQEFSQLTVSEPSESSNADEENFQASLLEYDWFESDGSQKEMDDTDPCSSCSSPEENSYEGENRSLEALELVDDFSVLDGEVGLRLNQMVPIPHVPKINGDIPSIDEATSDHQRLLDRLSLYDLVEHKVQGDGNCQFRALSDQFYRTTEHHKFVRQQVINQLKCCPDIYEGYVPMAYSKYLKKLSKNGEWGDHVTLQAAADSYGVKIFVITSFKDTCYIEIVPNIQKSNRVICLSFWAEVHYNSIYPEGGTDLPALEETKRKKRWWHFRNKNN